MSKLFNTPTTISPEQFEVEIQKHIKILGFHLPEFQVSRREKLVVSDGEYEIDVLARFEVLGVSFRVLIECKHHKNPIKREVVQILNDRWRSTGSQKGIIFSTVRFQSGAIQYAQEHGIALIQLVDGKFTYETKSLENSIQSPSWLPPFCCYMVSQTKDGRESYSKIYENNPEELLSLFAIKEI